MSFQILNTEGAPIAIALLDTEAAHFWGKAVHPKNYAHPHPERTDLEGFKKAFAEANDAGDNWFDKIGWIISEGANTWSSVRENFLAIYKDTIDKFGLDLCMEVVGIGSHINLINHWESVGYTPNPLKD